jgi:hypothetical protein
MGINRFHVPQPGDPADFIVRADTTVADSTEIDISEFAGGGFVMPDSTSATSIAFHVSTRPGGEYEPLYDRDNAAVTQTVAASRAYPFPDEIYGFGALKLVASGGDEADIRISLKG